MFKTYHGRIKRVDPDTIVNVSARSAGHARSLILAMARDAGYCVRLPDVQVRVGEAVRPHLWLDRPRLAPVRYPRPRVDLENHSDAQPQRPPSIGYECSLQEESPGVFQWYARTVRHVDWRAYGEWFCVEVTQ